MTDQELLARAEDAKKRAYAPYSNFPVGVALLCEDGTVFTGCNVENAAYGLCICGEQTAIVKAVSEGHQTFQKIVIKGNSEDYCLPCGACRQVMSEFAPNLEVLCANKHGDYKRYRLHELLASAFRLNQCEVN